MMVKIAARICLGLCLFLTVCNFMTVPVACVTTGRAAEPNEVAVIVGGGGPSSEYPTPVEVYMEHLPEPLRKCPETEEVPAVPDFPVPIGDHSAVFLPDFGIYVCGGKLPDNGHEYSNACYNYNPEELRYVFPNTINMSTLPVNASSLKM